MFYFIGFFYIENIEISIKCVWKSNVYFLGEGSILYIFYVLYYGILNNYVFMFILIFCFLIYV